MQNKSEHQFLQREIFFFIQIFRYERLGSKRENGKEEQGELFSSSFHAYERNADSLVHTCNQLQKVRT